ncbi:MAG TPA: Gfo/Idh/MocA family oxidoreductase [Chloroflexota bacterium]|jgi:predicted dehydrogenase|nr:Gfo/Idh/MocA family oxidoreductase [Chloroflexota bacterium]
MAQIGRGHGHAMPKWRALCDSPDVEAVGLFDSSEAAQAVLDDPSVVAVAVESRNHLSLAIAERAIEAGKHLWFDKPAGDDWPHFQRVMQRASEQRLHVQLGYMFRYQPGFVDVSHKVKGGDLGDVFEIRAHMSTSIDLAERREQSRHRGGILYDLGGHMLDQIVWLLGRPERITTVLRNDGTPELPAYSDNTVAVLDFPEALAIVDIAAMEKRPTLRRFEVYGTRGTAVVEPFDPGPGGFSRQMMYERELEAFVGVVRDGKAPDRAPAHELLVQETLLRATGTISA